MSLTQEGLDTLMGWKLAGAAPASGPWIVSPLENLPIGIAVMRGKGHRLVMANRLYRAAIGQEDALEGASAAEVLGPVFGKIWMPKLDHVLSTGEACEVSGAPGPDGSRYWHVSLFPLEDDDGAVSGVVTVWVDATAEKKARDEAALHAGQAQRQNEKLELAIEAAELGMWEWDVDSGEVIWSERECAIFGLPAGERPSYEFWRNGLHPEDLDYMLGGVAALLDPSSGGHLAVEHRVVRPDGTIRWVNSHGRMLYERRGDIDTAVRLIGTTLDITERKVSEELRQLLLAELDHRVKNLFAVTMAIVNATARTATGVREMADVVNGRLLALAASHALVRPIIAGDAQPQAAALDQLVGKVIEPFRGNHSRCEVAGPSVGLSRSGAAAMALVLHELATNSAKYGALKDGALADGALTVAWRVEDRRVVLEWAEITGQAERASMSCGFGSGLLKQSVERSLRGQLRHDWRADGVRVTIDFPFCNNVIGG